MTKNAEALLRRIALAAEQVGRAVRFMEVCGTHTHTIGHGGLRSLLPASIELISGPGCPVCVTSQRDIERMIWLARRPGVTVCTFGDMLRVPGVRGSLEQERAAGADVRVVYSPLEALRLAKDEPGREVVFLGVGFETTAPGVASVCLQAEAEGVGNFCVFACHKLIVPAMAAVLDGEVHPGGDIHLDGFITPGHVTVIIGAEAYEELARRHRVACVAAGFEPQDVLEAVALLTECVQAGRAGSFVQYARAVRPGGNQRAWQVLMEVFEGADAEWRGLGMIPASGLRFRARYEACDAARRFGVPEMAPVEIAGCRCGDVLRGRIRPPDCAAFGHACTPRHPLGPCMVSSEGACAARYRYG